MAKGGGLSKLSKYEGPQQMNRTASDPLEDVAGGPRLQMARRRSWRWLGLRTVALLVAAVPVLVSCRGAGSDASNLVVWRGRKYVVMCQSVAPASRSGPDSALYRPAAGGPEAPVTVYAITGLDLEHVVAVEGLPAICSAGTRPGQGVAFSNRTSYDEVSRNIAPYIGGAN